MTARRWLPLTLCGALLLAMPRTMAAATVEPDVVVLPPFVVEDGPFTPPWRHAQTGRFEILSCCPDELTRKLAQTVSRAYELVERFVPARLLGRSDVPDALIFYDEYYWPSASREAIAVKLRSGLPFDIPEASPSVAREEATTPARTFARRAVKLEPLVQGGPLYWDGPQARRRENFFDHLRLEDVDSMTTFILVARSGLELDGWHLSTGAVRGLLERRAPALPRWFISGFVGWYAEAEFGGDHITMPPFVWVSREVTDEIVRKTRTESPIIPLGEFFRGAATNAASSDSAARLAQSGLFVRWGLAPDQPARNEAFWRLIERAGTEPVDEALFRACFGASFADIEVQLAEYLPTAVRRSVNYLRPAAKEVELPDLRAASSAEVARIRGDWERLEARYVRRQLPVLESRYYELAQRTLTREDESVARDPGVLAVLGLLECDAENFGDAENYLKEATRQGVVRPRAYLELARLRLEELRGTSWHPERRISRRDADEVLQLLATARRQAPPLLAVYEVVAEVWSACEDAPSSEDLRGLDEGVTFFPGQVGFIHSVATLHAAHGSAERAASLIDLGLRHARNERERERLIALRAILPSTPSSEEGDAKPVAAPALDPME